jgi:hypothetical protein
MTSARGRQSQNPDFTRIVWSALRGLDVPLAFSGSELQLSSTTDTFASFAL